MVKIERKKKGGNIKAQKKAGIKYVNKKIITELRMTNIRLKDKKKTNEKDDLWKA